MRRGLSGAGIALCLLAAGEAFAFTIPPYEGFVTDTVGVLSQDEKQQLESVLSSFQVETTNEIAVLIVSTLAGEPIADVAVNVGRAWGVGTQENDNGIVLLIAMEDRELFIATGYGLEGAVPDIIAKYIIDAEITPLFREGQHAAGILRGIDALMQSTRGEYAPDTTMIGEDDGGGRVPFLFIMYFILIVCQWIAAILGRTKSWWLGGVFGCIVGTALFFLLTQWMLIPSFAALGLFLDYIISKNYHKSGKTSFWAGGNWGPGGGGGGGFSGFSGGSFGGGGAGGRW